MEMIKGNYVASDGKDYYNVGLNLSTGEIVMIKNASCTACAMDLACRYFGVENKMFINDCVKVFFHSTEPELNLKYIPKKYHKYFKEII